jgi:hypothetical protein
MSLNEYLQSQDWKRIEIFQNLELYLEVEKILYKLNAFEDLFVILLFFREYFTKSGPVGPYAGAQNIEIAIRDNKDSNI